MNSEHQMQKHSCFLRGSVITNRITYPYKEPEDNKKEKKKTTAQLFPSPADDARSTWARLGFIRSLFSLLTAAYWFTADENQVQKEMTEEERYVKLTRCISHLRRYLFKDSSFFLSHSWMVHQCWALSKQISHFHMKLCLSHKSLRRLICIRL